MFVLVLFLVILYERRLYNLRAELNTLEDWNKQVYSAKFRANENFTGE
jgi:hypothetical protein